MTSIANQTASHNNHLISYFRKSSDAKIIQTYNLETTSAEWNTARITFLLTLTQEMIHRGWDIQEIVTENGFHLSTPIQLNGHHIQRVHG
jgi:HSP90 family molecular chaperone